MKGGTERKHFEKNKCVEVPDKADEEFETEEDKKRSGNDAFIIFFNKHFVAGAQQ